MTESTMAAGHIAAWMERYQAAWASNRPEDIGGLFTGDAVYETRPHDPDPWRGRQEITDRWLAARDEPGAWSFTWELLGTDGATAFVQGVTVYVEGPSYENLWVVRMDGSGRAAAFTEWFMERSKGPAPGTQLLG
ncbi:hypothetical protein ACU18_00590 [Arthrobacter sp. ZBG10]|uniref:nuclear transport factor 2 family protein n=1 Tax=Arthrobacter sp. ZBG10 TaxID=1676590 RepID=UPI0006813030|nr:nuclear transport factor 2 family protein [Arthrobacter sp. ZBG10]KNH22972.1 hypothetical protein ACU18_00590 [Arthrobacter sp. ZBG10]